MSIQVKETKSVGGQIPEDLFWTFKQTYTNRRETATDAIIHAIQLYNDIPQNTDTENEVK